MGCNCSMINAIVSLIVIVVIFLGLYSSILNLVVAGWIAIIGSALIFIHSLMHKHSE